MKSLKLHNKYDVFTKIKKIITSCKTIEQIQCTCELIGNFENYYKDYYLSELLVKMRLETRDKIFNDKINSI